MQLASYLEGSPLMWMKLLHLHAAAAADNDDDDDDDDDDDMGFQPGPTQTLLYTTTDDGKNIEA